MMNFFRYNQKKVTIYCREKAGNGEGRILEKPVVDFSKTPIWTKNIEGIKKCKKEREGDVDAVPSVFFPGGQSCFWFGRGALGSYSRSALFMIRVNRGAAAIMITATARVAPPISQKSLV